ncbi:STAS domain-containing protein [Defluviimonas aestuarii]|uniref:STAS domain-containing protein n=1 Tax=Albidovulum aestuarii TaxID=1130726 RepID=UPI00249B9B60|nr:STAS domain-containing protein [Defluviimonas aestuarii]MDI3335183.1 STAS domain-containing protein [Defluviimonas aestuarii]
MNTDRIDGLDGRLTLILDPRLDLPAAGRLHAALLARTGTPLEIDATAVSHLGALCLQVLLAAARTWKKGGVSLVIRPRSARFETALDTYGVSLDDLQSDPAEAE